MSRAEVIPIATEADLIAAAAPPGIYGNVIRWMIQLIGDHCILAPDGGCRCLRSDVEDETKIYQVEWDPTLRL